MTPPDFYPHQAAIDSRIDRAIASGIRRILLPLPTGAGKTVIAAARMRNAASQGQRALFLDHRANSLRRRPGSYTNSESTTELFRLASLLDWARVSRSRRFKPCITAQCGRAH
jgi:type I site-specific restriction endonuclease